MRLKFLSLFIAIAACAAPALFADNVLDIPGGEATTVGIYIKSLDTGEVIADHNSQKAMTPASVTKAFTTASALHILGPDFRFETKVMLSGGRSAADRSRWEGNLVIKAVGDPTIESPDFKNQPKFTDPIISALKKMGISTITGTIVIEENMPGAGPIAQWEVEDIAWPYGAGIFGFNYAANCVRVYPNTGNSVPASNLVVELLPSPDGRLDILRGVDSYNLTVWGSQQNRANKRWSVNTTVPDPAAVYAGLLKDKLAEAAIEIGDNVEARRANEMTEVYTHRSAPLADVCRDLMKRSDNLFAEGVLRAFAPGETREKCLKKEKDFWAPKGLDVKNTNINDGSGLTRANRIPPVFLAEMLEKMARGEFANLYTGFFPVAGTDGTLKKFLENTRLKGNLALKTGSVSGVQTYAGYKIDSEGRPTHVVVIMVNGFFCPRATLRKQIESYLLEIF